MKELPVLLRSFYQIVHNEDMTCDVYLTPTPGQPPVMILRGVPYVEGLEDDIRRRYTAYVDSAEAIDFPDDGVMLIVPKKRSDGLEDQSGADP